MICASKISVARSGRALLDNVSLSVRAGEVLAILGPNGAGKSTLLKVMAGEFIPDSGDVAIEGRPLANWIRLELADERMICASPYYLTEKWPERAMNITFSTRRWHA